LKFYPICKDSPIFVEIHQPVMIKSFLQTLEVYCQTDENDDICPVSLNLITRSKDSNALLDQCKSKKCTESLVKIYKDVDLY